MATPNNGEIFLADSQGWKEEAEAVIHDVKDQVKDIKISEKLQVNYSSLCKGRIDRIKNQYHDFWLK